MAAMKAEGRVGMMAAMMDGSMVASTADLKDAKTAVHLADDWVDPMVAWKDETMAAWKVEMKAAMMDGSTAASKVG